MGLPTTNNNLINNSGNAGDVEPQQRQQNCQTIFNNNNERV